MPEAPTNLRHGAASEFAGKDAQAPGQAGFSVLAELQRFWAAQSGSAVAAAPRVKHSEGTSAAGKAAATATACRWRAAPSLARTRARVAAAHRTHRRKSARSPSRVPLAKALGNFESVERRGDGDVGGRHASARTPLGGSAPKRQDQNVRGFPKGRSRSTRSGRPLTSERQASPSRPKRRRFHGHPCDAAEAAAAAADAMVHPTDPTDRRDKSLPRRGRSPAQARRRRLRSKWGDSSSRSCSPSSGSSSSASKAPQTRRKRKFEDGPQLDAAAGPAEATKEKKRKVAKFGRLSKWDVAPTREDLVQQRQVKLTQCPRKRKEVYVGNLPLGHVTCDTLRETFTSLFMALPTFHRAYPDVTDPVVSINFPTAGKGQFAFVEFLDEALANTAVLMGGFEIAGRPTRIGRPQGYMSVPGLDVPPLDIQPLRNNGVVPAIPEVASIVCPSSVVANRLRELYFGNLVAGEVDETVLRELLSPACEALPEYIAEAGPAVTKVTIAPSSTFAFVQFQSAEIATRIIDVFNDTDLFGRRLRVKRPAGYVAATSGTWTQATQAAPPASDAFNAGAAAGAAAVAALSVL